MKKKNRQNKKIATNRLLIAVIFICIIVIGFCAWKIAPNLIEDAKSDSEYETAYELYIKPKEASAKAEEESSVDIPDSIADSEPEKRKRFSIDFTEWIKQELVQPVEQVLDFPLQLRA